MIFKLFNTKKQQKGYFRDTHVRVEGPAVHDLEHVYLDTLQSRRKFLIRKANLKAPFSSDPNKNVDLPTSSDLADSSSPTEDKDYFENTFVQILESNEPRDRKYISKALISILKQAQINCFITTPYFLTNQSLKKSIINAAKRGIDVRILTAVNLQFKNFL